jgi:DNA-directed RNA polymerase specialized sigma24 family protein
VDASGAETTGERIDLDAALARLPRDVRLCLALAYNDGMSHTEIAALTGLPLGTVKSHIARKARGACRRPRRRGRVFAARAQRVAVSFAARAAARSSG